MNLHSIISSIILRIFSCFPVDNKKIVFQSFYGKYYNDSPRFIFERMIKEAPSFKYIWLYNKENEQIHGAEVVRKGSIRSLYEIATSKVWVDNCRKPVWVKKRKEQYYIQTWHGGVCIKAVEKDAEETLDINYVKGARNDSKMADLFLSECEWRTKNYREAFWYTGEILKNGLPSSVVFFQDICRIRDKVYTYFGIPRESKIVLYAPTFRDLGSRFTYEVDGESVINALGSKYGGEWYFIFRLHPNVVDFQSEIEYSKHVLNGSIYEDVNEILFVSELLITDYSGCMFEGMRRGKKVLILANDYEEYITTNRKLYFDITQLPAPFARNNRELIDNIVNFNEVGYHDKRKTFVRGLGYYDETNACESVCDRILKQMGDQI